MWTKNSANIHDKSSHTIPQRALPNRGTMTRHKRTIPPTEVTEYEGASNNDIKMIIGDINAKIGKESHSLSTIGVQIIS